MSDPVEIPLDDEAFCVVTVETAPLAAPAIGVDASATSAVSVVLDATLVVVSVGADPDFSVETSDTTDLVVSSNSTTTSTGSGGATGSGSGGSGSSGGSGGSTSAPATLSVLAAVELAAGQPVSLDRVSGHAFLAQADVYVKGFVVGLASSTTSAGSMATIQSEVITLPDWTAVTGTTTLNAGATYYLDTTPGRLTTTPPNSVGQVCARIGLAANATTLTLFPPFPILL